MFCTNCGKALTAGPDGSYPNYCPYCGAAVDKSVIIQDAADKPAEEIKADAAETAAVVADIVSQAAIPAAESVGDTVQTAEASAASKETWKRVSWDEEPAAETANTSAAPAAETAEAKTSQAAETVTPPADPAGEAVPQTEPNVSPGPAPVSAAADEPKKKSKAPLIALLLVIVLAAGGFFVYQNLPSTKAGKLIAQADGFASHDNYEGALMALADAQELQPDNSEIAEKIVDVIMMNARYFAESDDDDAALNTYQKAADSAKALADQEKANEFLSQIGTEITSIADYYRREAKFSDAIYILNRKAQILPDDIAGITREQLVVYQEWAEYTYSEEDISALRSFKTDILDKALEKPEFSPLESIAGVISEKITNADMLEMMEEFANEMKMFTDKDQQSTACLHFNNSLISSLSPYNSLLKWIRQDPTTRAPYIVDLGSGIGAGLYNVDDAYFFYIGGYKNGERSGEGVWLTYMGNILKNSKRYYARGTWENDLPNGHFEIWDWNKSESMENPTIVRTSVDTKDGLYNGTAVVEYEGLSVFKPTYTDGISKTIDTQTAADGSTELIIAYGEGTNYVLKNVKGEGYQNGIFGFNQ